MSERAKKTSEEEYHPLQTLGQMELESCIEIGVEIPTHYRPKGIQKYNKTMKHLIPLRPSITPYKEDFPMANAGCLSIMTFSWLTSFMWRAYRKGIDATQLWTCPPQISSQYCLERFQRLWNEEIKSKGPAKASVTKVLFRSIKTRYIMSTLMLIIFLTFSFLGPSLVVQKILEYAESNKTDIPYGVSLVAALTASELCRSLAFGLFWFINVESGVRTRAGALTLVYDKILRLRSLKDKSVGELVNLCANDGQRIYEAVLLGNLLLAGPITGLAAVVYSLYLIGPWTLLGLSVFFLMYPFQIVIARLTTGFRRKCVVITDKRVHMMNEILTSIKLIKMYAWEKSFAKAIAAVRKRERHMLEKAAYVQSCSLAMTPLVPTFAVVFTFIGHTMSGNDLTASQVFTFLAIMNNLRPRIGVLPYIVRAFSDSTVSVQRIKSVLLMEERKPHKWRVPKANMALFFNNATLAWDVQTPKDNMDKNIQSYNNRKTGETENHQESETIKLDSMTVELIPEEFTDVLFNIHLTLEKGCLMGVCGSVGSGKSSIISAILGQMKLVKGEIAVDGSVAYVAQQAWILNATIKENILFGKDYDEERYNLAIHVCNLSSDIQTLPAGDETEVGERGINLSGGQKQRLSMARALYADSDIYLLDDPLSAVDSHVGHHIFKHCIKEALAEKTVLFVTHQLQYLNQCDQVVLVKDGRIAEKGTHESMMTADGDYANLIKSFHGDIEEDMHDSDGLDYEAVPEDPSPPVNHQSLSVILENQLSVVIKAESHLSLKNVGSISTIVSGGAPDIPQDAINIGQLVEAEEQETGNISWLTYKNYFMAAGGYTISLFVLVSFILQSASIGFSNWWLSYWISQGSGNTTTGQIGNITVISNSITDHPQLEMFNLVYGSSVLIILLFTCIKGFLFMKTTLKASSNLHDRVFVKVARSPMRFFDVTPTGRILNRFSKDLDEIDVRLPFLTEQFLQNLGQILLSMVMISFVFQWFIIAIVPLLVFFLFINKWFRVGVRQLKRLDNTTRSPWFSHITASIQGRSTINAFNKKQDFLKSFQNLMDTNSMPFFLFGLSMRWLALRLDMITIVITSVTALLVVLMPSDVIPPSLAGLALAYAIQMTGLFQFTVRLSTETEAHMTSVERINHYIENLESEAESVVKTSRPPSNWPTEGAIKLDRLYMKYRPGLPMVLKGVNFNIKPKEKIGIVGRTGSGKSSLGISLFRLVEAESGHIFIDDLDIAKMGLDDLRGKLSIIPQDPVLFVGTIRYNLDPFGEHEDEIIWSSLEKCHIKATITLLDKQLNSLVVENGENFSVGERQLICMARALLRHSKILMLDEATASIDTETDALIQMTIKEAFADCTMLTIAHRLNTVLDSDRIMVLDDGKVIEFDKPSTLLSDPESVFSTMMNVVGAQKQAAMATDAPLNN